MSSCLCRPRARLKCGEVRFPKSPLHKLKRELEKQALLQRLEKKSRACDLTNDQETYGCSPKVLIHGWEKRLSQRLEHEARDYRDCSRCADLKRIDWSPDVIVRRREHPTTIFQSPLLPDRHKSSCLYAVQLKSWYDEQYNDWAKRHLRERLYNRYGIDRGAEYVYRNLDLKPKSAKKLAPTKVLADEEYPITECKPTNYCLLEWKQQQWREDIDIMLGRRVADTTHHAEFQSAFRSAARPPPASPPPAKCLRPRRRYRMARKKLPCGETELCIQCADPPPEGDEEQDIPPPDCSVAVDGLMAI